MRRTPLLIALLLVAACRPTPPVAPPAPPPVSPLVGTWGLAAEPCAGDNALAFRADGSWSAYGSAGSWTLAGNTLTTRETQREGADGSMTRPASPAETRRQLQFAGSDRLTLTGSDGKVTQLKRCR